METVGASLLRRCGAALESGQLMGQVIWAACDKINLSFNIMHVNYLQVQSSPKTVEIFN
jgi:galactitol-specific phosphotransferase system IIB component